MHNYTIHHLPQTFLQQKWRESFNLHSTWTRESSYRTQHTWADCRKVLTPSPTNSWPAVHGWHNPIRVVLNVYGQTLVRLPRILGVVYTATTTSRTQQVSTWSSTSNNVLDWKTSIVVSLARLFHNMNNVLLSYGPCEARCVQSIRITLRKCITGLWVTPRRPICVTHPPTQDVWLPALRKAIQTDILGLQAYYTTWGDTWG